MRAFELQCFAWLVLFIPLLAVASARAAEPGDAGAGAAPGRTRPGGVEPIAAFAKGTRVLFQGDSIIDGNRGRNADPNHILGHGYAFIIAAKYGAALVKFQRVFDGVCEGTPAEHWIWDGVHPTYSGHHLMAYEWERTVRAFWPAAAR